MTIDHIERVLNDSAALSDAICRFDAIASDGITDRGCRIWRGAKTGNGYGSFKVASRVNVGAHRVAWAIANRESPGSRFVCHRCDNPVCVNPAHLFIGDHSANMTDRNAKGRAGMLGQRGESNHAAKLDEGKVREIRRRIAGGQDNMSIAARYGVSHSLISAIRRGKAWKMVGAAGVEPATSAV